MENLLDLKNNNPEIYNRLFEYNCKVTYNNKLLYEGIYNEEIDLGKYDKSQIVYEFNIDDNNILILCEENKDIERLHKIFEDKDINLLFEDAKVYNKAMNLANKLPLYNLINEDDENIKSNIKKYGLNFQKIYENLNIK